MGNVAGIHRGRKTWVRALLGKHIFFTSLVQIRHFLPFSLGTNSQKFQNGLKIIASLIKKKLESFF